VERGWQRAGINRASLGRNWPPVNYDDATFRRRRRGRGRGRGRTGGNLQSCDALSARRAGGGKVIFPDAAVIIIPSVPLTSFDVHRKPSALVIEVDGS